MSWIIKQLSGSLGPYILVAMAVALLGLTVTTKVLWSNNAELHEDLAVSKAAVEALTSANASNQTTITKLKTANQSWVDLFDAQKIKDQQAADENQKFRAKLEAANRAIAEAIRRERQEPDCVSILQMDIQRACPAHAQRMRDDAAPGTH